MKNIFYFLLISVFFTSCGGSKKSLDHGDYYTAVYKSVKSLQRNATKEKHILTLKEAYPKANAKDFKAIAQLKLDGDPQNWDKIYKIYKNLDSRQDLVQTVTPLYLNGQEIDFEYKNYQKNMSESKLRAAQFYYNHAKQLMQNDDQTSNRQAYAELQKVKSYFSTYEDTDQLMKEAAYLGTSHVLISIKNESQYRFNRADLANLLNFGTNDLNSTWKKYYTSVTSETNYDYDIYVRLIDVKFSDAIRERGESVDKKEVEDGWEYVLDDKGNVKKDTLGNDIKKKKFKIIQCKIRTEVQKKSLTITANINYINKLTNQSVGNSTVSAIDNFKHSSASAFGDMNALSTNSLTIIKNKPIAFPTNEEMIKNSNPILKEKIKNSIKKDKGYIK